MKRLLWILWLMAFGSAAGTPIRVTALHPLMADLARQVGGDRVQVVDLTGGSDPHHFEPKPADLKQMRSSLVILASGKGMEPFLDRVRAAMGEEPPIVEVGRTLPSLTVGKDAVYSCCPSHGSDSADPHWWHGIDNMRRASRVVAQELAARDPAGKDAYLANASAYGQRLGQLKQWAKAELAKVPRKKRKLVTSHNAFAYFAKEFGFEVIAVAGLNKEQNTTPQDQAKTIEAVQKSGVGAVFPEFNSSAKILASVASATGVRLAEPLIADGNGRGNEAGFEGMIRHNVISITQALAAP